MVHSFAGLSRVAYTCGTGVTQRQALSAKQRRQAADQKCATPTHSGVIIILPRTSGCHSWGWCAGLLGWRHPGLVIIKVQLQGTRGFASIRWAHMQAGVWSCEHLLKVCVCSCPLSCNGHKRSCKREHDTHLGVELNTHVLGSFPTQVVWVGGR